MFKCQNCQTIVPAHTKAARIVVENRFKEYPYRKRAFWAYQAKKEKRELIDDIGGLGCEIAREMVVCPECAAKLSKSTS
jgi:hypothetical protein